MAEENNENNKDMFAVDEALGTIMGAKGPKLVDTKKVDEAISQIEKPLSSSVYDQLAAMYRSKGEGAVLRAQKNMQSLFLPTINLIKEREADAKARYALLKDQLEEFDDSTIFGQADGTEMPIVDEIKNLANTTKEYMRELSRLNPTDDRYDELRKKIKKNNDAIAKFDDINKKLLEIRNAQDGSDDDSLWSTSMTETERDMWMDIYNGRGANIKIQNGELVWTDTSGKTKYNFSDISDYGSKRDALGGDDTDLGTLHFLTMDGSEQGTRSSGFFNDKKGDVKKIQTALNNLGFTDDDGNKLKVDGNFGDKTEEAYNKYLAKKDELEQAYFDENLSEDDIKKYNITTEVTGVGETRTIELSKINSGPTLLANDATNAEIIIQGKISELINQGVTTESPIYQRAIKSMIFQLGQLKPNGIKSLIFDGIGADDDDIFTSINTDSFIQSIISNQKNAEVFNIKDVDNITPQELQNAIEKLKSNDITFSYFNQNNEKKSLRKLFLEWYKGQADARVDAGVVDAGVRTNIKGGGSGGRSGGGGNKNKPTSSSFKDYTSTYGDGKTYLPSSAISVPVFGNDGQPLLDANGNPVTRRFDANQIQITFENGQPAIQYDPNDENTKYQLSRNETIDTYVRIYGKKERENIVKFVDEQIASATTETGEDLNTTYSGEPILKVETMNEEDKIKYDELTRKLDNLLVKDTAVGGRQLSGGILLNYGDDDFVVNSLNREFGKFGFEFEYEDLGMFESDAFIVRYKNNGFTIKFDTTMDDYENTRKLIAIMKALYLKDEKKAARIYSGEDTSYKPQINPEDIATYSTGEGPGVRY